MVVEADAGGETQEALQYALFEAVNGAGPMPFQGEDILAGSKDGFDALPKRGQMRSLSRLVFAFGPDQGGLKILDRRSELPARIALVGKEDLPTLTPAALKEFKADLAFVPLGRAEGVGAGSAVQGKHGMQAYPPEVAGVTRTVPVVTEVGKSGAKHRLPASLTLDRRRVDKQEIIVETGALLAQDDEQPLKDRGEPAPALEIARLAGDDGKQVGKRFPCPLKETPVRGDAHDGLRDGQGDDLGVGGSPTDVSLLLWQKIIGCAINEGAEGVEVGVIVASWQTVTVAPSTSASLP